MSVRKEKPRYSAAQIYPNQNIRVIRVSSIRVYAYAYTQIRVCIQLFRQRLSHKSVKAYATMPIGIMGTKSLALTD